MIAGQRRASEPDKDNDFSSAAERTEEHWLALCRRFDIDYGVPRARSPAADIPR